MTLTACQGLDWVGNAIQQTNVTTFAAVGLMDASGEKVGMVGYVWKPTRPGAAFNIRKVHFRTGAVAVNAASVVQVSLQDLSATAGPPYQPDGGADQTVAIAGSGFSSDAWHTTGALSADRSVTTGTLLAVVWEYTTFTAADSIVIAGPTALVSPASMTDPLILGGRIILNTGSWAAVGAASNIVLECDDGSYAFLLPCTPFSDMGSVSVQSGGAVTRAGAYFSVPVETKIDALGLCIAVPNGADGSFILYDTDGTTALVTVGMDNDRVMSTAQRMALVAFDPITLTAGGNYRFVFSSSTATAATVPYGDVSAAAMLDCLPLGSSCHWTQHNGSAWAQTATRRPFFGFARAAIHDGAAGGTTIAGTPLMRGMVA